MWRILCSLTRVLSISGRLQRFVSFTDLIIMIRICSGTNSSALRISCQVSWVEVPYLLLRDHKRQRIFMMLLTLIINHLALILEGGHLHMPHRHLGGGHWCRNITGCQWLHFFAPATYWQSPRCQQQALHSSHPRCCQSRQWHGSGGGSTYCCSSLQPLLLCPTS